MKLRSLPQIAAALVLAVGAPAAEAGAPLRQCADPTNLPFSTAAPRAVARGTPGLYIEIGQAVAAALHRPLQTVWSLSYFGKGNVRQTLLAGQCDFAVGLPAVSDFMGPRVIFTRSILEIGYALVVPKGSAPGSVDDLAGKRVAVQFSSPPQSLLATRDDLTTVTVMDPEEGMRRLAAGEVDAAFVWGPSAGYVNHAELHDAFLVIPIEAPQMKWRAAIGFSAKRAALRDEIDAVLPRLERTIRRLEVKYALPLGRPLMLAVATPAPMPMLVRVAMTAKAKASPKGNVTEGKKIFNGTCAHCHGPDAVVAERRVNLRLLKKKYGDQLDEIFLATVSDGRVTKGMPAWKNVFKREELLDVLAYLKTVAE